MPSGNRECQCGPDGIDSKCVHLGGAFHNPIPAVDCDCYACDEARGGPKVVHLTAYEKQQKRLHQDKERLEFALSAWRMAAILGWLAAIFLFLNSVL